jgi:hypothetical protein
VVIYLGKELNQEFRDTFKCDILEMVSENSLINVPIYPGINMDIITGDDPDPKFVNVEVLRGNTISGNSRRYNNNNVTELIGMIPGRQGFLGHPDPSKHGFEFREPQCIFVGALKEILQDGSARAVAKAYLFRSSNLREWIPKSIAVGNPMTVSINGRADVIRNGEYTEVVRINELESIDWANPGTEGIGTSKAMSVVREMENNNGGSEMESKEIIAGATVTEFKAYNPTAYVGMVKSVTVTELREHSPELVKGIEDAVLITEMSVVVGGTEKSVKLTEMQSIITELEGRLATATAENATIKLTEYKAAKIVEMIPVELREQVSKRVGGATEADIDSAINGEITFIREMRGLAPNEPLGRAVAKDRDSDSVKESVKSLFGGGVKEEKK